MQQYASAGIPLVPNPTEAIELYSRSQEQVECEVIPIKVEDSIAEVDGKLSASEMKEVYDQGKYDFADPTGENPGFKIGPKLNVQYFKADFQVALTNEMNKLTDAQVQQEYDRLVAEKSPIVMEPIEEEDDSIKLPISTDSDVDAPETETTGDAPADVTPPPALESPAVETSGTEVPAVQVPAVESPTAPAIPLIETPAVEGGTAVPATEGSFRSRPSSGWSSCRA